MRIVDCFRPRFDPSEHDRASRTSSDRATRTATQEAQSAARFDASRADLACLPITHISSRIADPLQRARTHPTALSPSQIDLIGVARWPDPRHNQEATARNARYARSFHRQSLRLSQDIRRGRIADYGSLWKRCREWRLDHEMRHGSRNARFGEDRMLSVNTAHYETPLVAGTHYEYASRNLMARVEAYLGAERIDDWISNRGEHIDDLRDTADLAADTQARDGWSPTMALRYLSEVDDLVPDSPRRLIDPPFTLTCRTADDDRPYLVVDHEPTIDIDDRSIPLTAISMEWQPDRSGPFLWSADTPRFGAFIHPSPAYIPILADKLGSLAEPLLDVRTRSPGSAPPSRERTIDTLAEVHWLSAHAMPDRRGSAAKAELAVRAMAHANGIELPPFRCGIVPDIEAFLRSSDDFRASYRDFFEPDLRA